MKNQTTILPVISLLMLIASRPMADPLVEPSVDDMSRKRDLTSSCHTIRIESRIGNAQLKNNARLSIRRDETPVLRVQAAAGARVRWYLIFADLSRNYQNANTPWQEKAYQWTGFDRIHYYRIEMAALRDRVEVNPIPHLETARRHIVKWLENHTGHVDRTDFYHSDTGTFWIQVEVEDERGFRRSAGIEEATDRGLPLSVFRLSIRDDDTYLGYVKSFYNVPGVFGSVLSQSIHHVGADCADILMAARAEWKQERLDRNYNVQMLVTKFPRVAKTSISGGLPAQTLEWGRDVTPGDFIAVSYSEDAKKYHHIGALMSDENGNGILDAKDSILHAGPDPLHRTLLEEGMFDAQVVILRHNGTARQAPGARHRVSRSGRR